MQPGEACPVCRRLDGGHDKAVHDSVEGGAKSYPPPPNYPKK